VEEQTGRQRPLPMGGEQPGLEGVLADEGDDGHDGIWTGRPRRSQGAASVAAYAAFASMIAVSTWYAMSSRRVK